MFAHARMCLLSNIHVGITALNANSQRLFIICLFFFKNNTTELPDGGNKA